MRDRRELKSLLDDGEWLRCSDTFANVGDYGGLIAWTSSEGQGCFRYDDSRKRKETHLS